MSKESIKEVRAREIIDSRGQPTVEVDVRLESGAWGRAAVPSGASTGEHESLEMRDADKGRFLGKGVLRAVENVNKRIAPSLIGKDCSRQAELDEAMIAADGTPNKSNFGANAVLGVSMACSRAAAAARAIPLYRYLREAFSIQSTDWLLPAPMLNIINGGAHANNGLNVQEFMVVPTGAQTFSEALRVGCEVYAVLKKLIAAKGLSTAVGDEGGFAPRLGSHEDALDFIISALKEANADKNVRLALDVASSEFYKNGKYQFAGGSLSSAELGAKYEAWCAKYPIISIEDPFDQDDWAGWKQFTAKTGQRWRLVGDDLFVTKSERLERGIKESAASAILIKLNQVGSLTETVRAVRRAQEAGFCAIISHRSGETEDAYIADLSVALNAGAIKTGAPCRSERLAKYNQLLRIEEELGSKARYARDAAFSFKEAALK